MLVLPEINSFHLLLPVTLLLVGGWMTPTPSQGPPIPQGGGGLMGMTMTMAGGVGGGTRNLEHIYIYIIYEYIILDTVGVLQFWGKWERPKKAASDSSHWKSGFIPVNHGHGDRDGLRQINLESFVYPHRNSIWHSWHTSPQQLCIRNHQESRKYQQIFKSLESPVYWWSFQNNSWESRPRLHLCSPLSTELVKTLPCSRGVVTLRCFFSGTGELHEILMYNTTWQICGRSMFHAVPHGLELAMLPRI